MAYLKTFPKEIGDKLKEDINKTSINESLIKESESILKELIKNKNK